MEAGAGGRSAAESAGLRAGRIARGWSQSEAARELVDLGRSRGVPVAAPASLKSLLSRWENGHAVPEPHYRALLAGLYGRTAEELGIDGAGEREAGAGVERLHSAFATASALVGVGTGRWWEQLAAARALDDELGAAGAGELVRAQVDRLEYTLIHVVVPADRVGVAAVLSAAAGLAGDQALDRGRPDEAWLRYRQAERTAQEAEQPGAAVAAVAGQAAVLVEVGRAATAVALLDAHPRATSPAERARMAGAAAMARAAAGDRPGAVAALAAAAHSVREAPAAGSHRPVVDLAHSGDRPAVELADLHRWHGRALVDLGDRGAAAALEQALAARPRSARHRADVHADLALALASARPDESAEHARVARELALGIGSGRTTARLSRLGRGT